MDPAPGDFELSANNMYLSNIGSFELDFSALAVSGNLYPEIKVTLKQDLDPDKTYKLRLSVQLDDEASELFKNFKQTGQDWNFVVE